MNLPALDLPDEGSTREGDGVPLLDVCRHGPIEVLLDGVPVDHAFAYSRSRGWAIRYVTDGRGAVVRNGAGALTEKLHGEVTLRRKLPGER